MNPSPIFLLIIGIVVVIAVPAFYAFQNDAAKHSAEAIKQAQRLEGYDTPEQVREQRVREFTGKLDAITVEAESRIAAMKHEQDMATLRQKLEDAKAANADAKASRERMKQSPK